MPRVKSWPPGPLLVAIGEVRQSEGWDLRPVRDRDAVKGWVAARFLGPAERCAVRSTPAGRYTIERPIRRAVPAALWEPPAPLADPVRGRAEQARHPEHRLALRHEQHESPGVGPP